MCTKLIARLLQLVQWVSMAASTAFAPVSYQSVVVAVPASEPCPGPLGLLFEASSDRGFELTGSSLLGTL